MPMLTAQQKLRELGRIRLGERTGTRGAPKRLDTFRFTSASRALIEQAAAVYGGTVQPWKSQRGDEWSVVSEASEIEIVIPPRRYLDQWFELWKAGGLQRRCNGEVEQLTQTRCKCPHEPSERQALAKEGEACSPTSYLWMMLPGIEGLGTWRLVTGSWYAAEELSGVADLLAQASVNNLMIPASLRIDPRMRKRDGRTNRYAVPVIDAKIDPGLLTRGELPERMKAPPLGEGRRGTQRVELGSQPQLPGNSEFKPPDEAQVDESAEIEASPNGEAATAVAERPAQAPAPADDYPWIDAALPERVQDAWQMWIGWVAACESGEAIDALAEHFEATYRPDDSVRKTISSMFYVEIRKRRTDLA